MEGELGSPTVNPAFLAHPASLGCSVRTLHVVWYSVEQGSDAEEEPRSSGALDWGDGQASLHGRHPRRAILFWTRPRHQARQ
jgi:hypothetical protein